MAKVLEMRASEEGRLDALERDVGLGNAPRAARNYTQLIMSSLRALDLDGVEEYLSGLAEFSSRNPAPGLENVDWVGQQSMAGTLRSTMNLVCGTSTSKNDKKADHAAIAKNVGEEVRLLRQANAHPLAIQAAEMRLKSWLDDPDALTHQDTPADDARRKVNTQKAAAILTDNIQRARYPEHILEANVEFERLKQRVQAAEQAVKVAQEQDRDMDAEPSHFGKLYIKCLDALDAVQHFCERKGNEVFRVTFGEGAFEAMREPYVANMAAEAVRKPFTDLLIHGDLDEARKLVLSFEAGLDPRLRSGEQAKQIVSGWLETVTETAKLVKMLS